MTTTTTTSRNLSRSTFSNDDPPIGPDRTGSSDFIGRASSNPWKHTYRTRDVTASSSAYLRSGTRNCGAVQGRPARPLPLCVIFRRSSLDKLSLYTAVTGAPLVPSLSLFPRRHYIIYTPLENPRLSRAPLLSTHPQPPIIDAFFVFARRPSAISTLKRASIRDPHLCAAHCKSRHSLIPPSMMM